MPIPLDKLQGALVGLATGDALGTTVEFSQRGTFTPLTDIVGGGPFNLKPGEWTDDTSMAICLAESLIANGKMNLSDQLDRYLRWSKDGENSVTGHCFDIGFTVSSALNKYEDTSDPHSGSTNPRSAGNGSIMRLAPIPIFFANEPTEAINAAAESSLTTHGATEAVDACRLFCHLILRAFSADNKQTLFESTPPPNLCPAIADIASGSYQTKDESEIVGSGYVVKSLEAALWAFWNTNTFQEGALLAVNLGDDADTTGAVYGQIAGAYYGLSGIPHHWLEKLAWKEKLISLATQLSQTAR